MKMTKQDRTWYQAQLGVLQVELDFILQAGTCQILNFAQNLRQSQSVQGTKLNLGGGHRTEKMYTKREGHRTYFLNTNVILSEY